MVTKIQCNKLVNVILRSPEEAAESFFKVRVSEQVGVTVSLLSELSKHWQFYYIVGFQQLYPNTLNKVQLWYTVRSGFVLNVFMTLQKSL